MGSLICIDMQQSFIFRHEQFPGYGATIDAVKLEIESAKKRKDFIIFVEFCTESRRKEIFNKYPSRIAPTLKEITNLTINYPNKIFVYKKTCDGGAEVISALKHTQAPKKNIKICGVYTNACVRETVRTISDRLKDSNISVISHATTASGGDDWQHSNGIELIKQLGGNVAVC